VAFPGLYEVAFASPLLFLFKVHKLWRFARLRLLAACGWGFKGGALTASSVALACVQRNEGHSTISRKLA
jgi:outer membrane lipopolysaccharide assembly protein LptE/RlpB